jgi:PAS domain S-box-containing protein
MLSTFSNIPGIWANQSTEILEQLLKPICVYDMGGRTLYASQKFLKLLQTSAQSVDFFDYFASESTPQSVLFRFWDCALRGETIEFLTKIRDGWAELECSLQYDADAKLMFLTSARTDADGSGRQLLDAYEQATAALIRTEEKWKAIVLNSPCLYIQTSDTGEIIYTSPAVERTLGYQSEELLGRQLTEFIHPENFNEFRLVFQLWSSDIPTTQPGLECWWKAKSGQWVCLHLQGQRLPSTLEAGGVIISGYDISDRKCLETELKASEEKFRALLLNIPGTVFRCNSIYKMQFISDGIEAITGYPASVFLHNQDHNQEQSYLSLVHPEDIALLKNSLVQTVLDRHCYSIEYRIIHADGSVRWVWDRKQGVFDQNGNLLGMDGILLDITERKQIEAKIQCCQELSQAMSTYLLNS